MSKSTSLWAMLAALIVAGAICPAAEDAAVLLKEDFDGNLLNWQGLGNGWRVERGVGANGSCALVWRKPEAGKNPSLLKHHLAAFRPGMKLEVSCRAKVLDPGSKPPPAHLCDIEWWNLDGEWAGGMGLGYEAIFRRLPVDGDGWSEIRFEVPYQRADVSRSVFEFFTLPDTAGVVAVDDVVIRELVVDLARTRIVVRFQERTCRA